MHRWAAGFKISYIWKFSKYLGNFFFSLTQTFCRYSEPTISDIAKGFFVSKRRRNGEHSVRFTFFDFDLCPEILPDIDILKLHYSMSDFPNPWMNTAQTPSVVCFGHTVNISTIFRLFKAILWVKIGLRNFGAKFKFRRIFTKIADISTQRSKSKNVNRTECSSFLLLLDAKNRLSISEVVSSEYVQKVWGELKKSYLGDNLFNH